jgi:HAD superfamily hydrolase (TIGR01484 family)
MSIALRELGGPVRALFSDLDGTLTTRGRVEGATYSALERLGEAGVPVVLVTGRPAGWAQAIAALVPFAAVIAENGGITFVREGLGLKKISGVSPASLPEWRRGMLAAAVEVMQQISGARLSSDSRYREVDLAIDWNEEARLGREEADAAVEMLRGHGFEAVRSSVHVNFGPPMFDKLSACKIVIAKVLAGDPDDLAPYVYVGDALNDAPMFAGFEKSVGVANIRRWWDELSHKPRYLTEKEEGAGLREVVDHLLAIRARA